MARRAPGQFNDGLGLDRTSHAIRAANKGLDTMRDIDSLLEERSVDSTKAATDRLFALMARRPEGEHVGVSTMRDPFTGNSRTYTEDDPYSPQNHPFEGNYSSEEADTGLSDSSDNLGFTTIWNPGRSEYGVNVPRSNYDAAAYEHSQGITTRARRGWYDPVMHTSVQEGQLNDTYEYSMVHPETGERQGARFIAERNPRSPEDEPMSYIGRSDRYFSG